TEPAPSGSDRPLPPWRPRRDTTTIATCGGTCGRSTASPTSGSGWTAGRGLPVAARDVEHPKLSQALPTAATAAWAAGELKRAEEFAALKNTESPGVEDMAVM